MIEFGTINASVLRVDVKLGWPVEKVPRPYGFPGGKSRLTGAILAHTPPHTTYVEPFFGGGAVFWAAKPVPKMVINDVDPQTVGFLKGFSCPALKTCISKNPPTVENRRKFTQRFRQGSSSTCDFFMARRLSFNSNGKDVNYTGKVHSGNVGGRLVPNCEATAKRLKSAQIKNEDFRKIARENDKPGVFQMWDPPYEGRAKGLYKFEQGTSPREVCAAARSLKHAKVLITHYDNAEVRAACQGLEMKSIPHVYVSRTRNHGKAHKVRELLIANYPLHTSRSGR
jgi:DNA adenine methylase